MLSVITLLTAALLANAWPAPVAPYTPSGGVGVSPDSPAPKYEPYSDFDFQSLNLALNQEWIELDLFYKGLEMFTLKDYEDAGLNSQDRELVEFMAEQERGHAQLITDMLGPRAAKECTYTYPFKTVPEFVDSCQKLTRFGESGVYGFLPHLNSRPTAQLLLQSITTEARQQMIFRQFEGLFPMPVWFETGITQSMAWTLLAPYIATCPDDNPKIEWQNFPALDIIDNPWAPDPAYPPAITHNRTALSTPRQKVSFTWENPGKKVGYNDLYTTSTSAGKPKFAAWISQLNTTYTPLNDISGNSAWTYQPDGTVFVIEGYYDPIVNETMFILITDTDLHVTPYNISLLNDHVVAGPAIYQSG
ncbi:hypothetical protein DACRYDRAFT_78763 [Dacryopinax primogenitus]|uniref:Rds1 protein n=1 Tax=Dacryopinax primogenitus (strain DJM 731) TaxID=1858805 RepID=M5GE03_DACPD|nr:uncharacterized protein DACRYDRAFT_78763 [Dacryopinax primogenitus]EJU02858.1 hypothetical protein DACRYDRAFT_78763 [Dacryopinax primogenitus]